MKKTLLTSISGFLMLTFSAQAPTLGTVKDFVLFSTDGAVTNVGASQLTGNVGTNNGSSTDFGNVNGVMHDGGTASAQCAADLLDAYNEMNATTPNFNVASPLGNGTTLIPGVYQVSAATVLSGELLLNGQNNSNSVFVFLIQGPLSTNANSKVKLINGALACNVYWKIEGLLDMGTGTSMKGTLIVNNAGINMNVGDTLEGRALTTAGAISINGILAYTPVGCGSPTLLGPAEPVLGVVGCYGIFSGDGSVQNAGITSIEGDVGTNGGLTVGFDPLLVTGIIHPIPDVSTAQASASLLTAYNNMNTLTHDIELLYPAQFGSDLVLTPHTYVMNGLTSLTDTVYMNAMGNANAIFVIKINGALSTSAYSNVKLINGAQAKNIYWMVNGAVDIMDYSIFNGTIISQGAINLFTGVTFNGRALTNVGALETFAIDGNAVLPTSCINTSGIESETKSLENVLVYPNPFHYSTTILLENASTNNSYELQIYNSIGVLVMNKIITTTTTEINSSELPSGIYFYKVKDKNNSVNSGTIISSK
jgi:hypothetical protein